MGNTNQKNKNSDNVIVKEVEKQLQLLKNNPIFTTFFNFFKQTIPPPPPPPPPTTTTIKVVADDKSKVTRLGEWQVCLVAAYFVGKWAHERWIEHRDKKRSRDDAP